MPMIAFIAAIAFASQTSAPAPLQLTLAIPESTMALGILGNQNNIHVMFSQTGKSDLHVWGEHCSWGYETISFELRSPDTGAISPIKRIPRAWDKNFPYVIDINPGRHFIRSVAFGDGSWPRFPIEQDKVARYWIRAVYMAPKDEMATQHKVVTGTYYSQWELVDFKNHVPPAKFSPGTVGG